MEKARWQEFNEKILELLEEFGFYNSKKIWLFKKKITPSVK